MVSPLRVLIVDDQPGIRSLIRTILEDITTDIDECADGDGVLTHFEAFRPHWVLMDVWMPRMDGISATALLCAAHPEARVIVVSDHDLVEVWSDARLAGAKAYVSKRNLLDLRELLTLECGKE